MSDIGSRLTSRLRRLRLILAAFIVVAIAGIAVPAAYSVADYRAAYGARYDQCQGQDGEEAFGAGSAATRDEDADRRRQQAEGGERLAARKVLEPPLVVACQANAIARAGLNVQFWAMITGVVPLVLGMIGVFAALWQLARE